MNGVCIAQPSANAICSEFAAVIASHIFGDLAGQHETGQRLDDIVFRQLRRGALARHSWVYSSRIFIKRIFLPSRARSSTKPQLHMSYVPLSNGCNYRRQAKAYAFSPAFSAITGLPRARCVRLFAISGGRCSCQDGEMCGLRQIWFCISTHFVLLLSGEIA